MSDAVFGPCVFPARQEAELTAEEQNVAQARLWALLARQARLRTQGDHSSLREEDAAELLDSLVFTLRYQLFREGLALPALLTADLAEMLQRGQASLQACFCETEALYDTALRTVAALGSRSLQDTLKGVGAFFRPYDVRLFAHRISADIDYQLCLPVPEGLRGVLYVRSYLERLLCENALITRFATERVLPLLRRASPDYRDLLINLYEPVAAAAVGLSLLGGGETLLELTRAQAEHIHRKLTVIPPGGARALLWEAAEAACRRLCVTDAGAVSYLCETARTFRPRIALSPEAACAVFSAV